MADDPKKTNPDEESQQPANKDLPAQQAPEITLRNDDSTAPKDDFSDAAPKHDITYDTNLSETTPPDEDALLSVEPAADAVAVHAKHGKLASFKHWMGSHKVVTVLLCFVIIVGVLAAIPFTRYKIAGLFLKQTITVEVMDSETHKPISNVVVTTTNSVQSKTDNKGRASLKIKVGDTTLSATKAYYTSGQKKAFVPILKPKNTVMIELKASGRQVPVSVINKLTGKPIENATLSAVNPGSKTENIEVKTDKTGHATIVLPASAVTVKATIKAAGFNDITTTVLVTAQSIAGNNFQLTPAGKLYFLSNHSGKIDVVKTDLDGANRQTVLAGTGNEDNHGTVLLASRDWKYLTLLSKRDGGDYAKLFLIDTSSDKVTTMDEGQAIFGLVGWHDHSFVYNVTRDKQKTWQNGYQAIKSYDATTAKLMTLDETQASGDQNTNTYQSFSGYYITDYGVIYSVAWDAVPYPSRATLLVGKEVAIRGIAVDGKNKKDFKTFDAIHTGYVQAKIYEPKSIYYAVYNNDTNANKFYEYEDGAVKDSPNTTQSSFDNSTYATYLLSPSGAHVFWSELRDGKNSMLVGDDNGKNSNQIALLSDYTAYGWYTDDYVLVAKKASELWIIPAAGGKDPIKITDYYKPDVSFNGYGYGYGGL